MKLRLTPITLSLAAAGLMAALVAGGISAEFAEAQAGPSGAKDPVVAKVNGAEIKLSEVQRVFDRLPPQFQQTGFENAMPIITDNLIDTRLAAAEARRRKLDETPAFKETLSQVSDRLLEEQLLENVLTEAVSDADVKKRYDDLVKDLPANFEVHARHILLKTEADAKAVIQTVLAGKDFAEAAREKSTGPTGPDGGDLGFFSSGQMVPEFEKAAFALEKGQISKTPVKTQFGWHVIKVEDKRRQEPPSLESLEPEIRRGLGQQAQQAFSEKLREDAKIEVFNSKGEPIKQ